MTADEPVPDCDCPRCTGLRAGQAALDAMPEAVFTLGNGTAGSNTASMDANGAWVVDWPEVHNLARLPINAETVMLVVLSRLLLAARPKLVEVATSVQADAGLAPDGGRLN